MINVLVTGANGFVGGAALRHLHGLPEMQVSAAVRGSSAPAIQARSVVHVGNLSGESDWAPALAGMDVVVHAAARVHGMDENSSDPLLEFRRVNAVGTTNIARQAAAAGVKRFVFISSVKVNGESTDGRHPFTSHEPPGAADAYGISKAEAEAGLRQIAAETGMEVVIIRPPLVYGPRVKGNFASLVQWVRKGVPLPLGAVRNRRSLVALDNLVNFIALCADRERSPSAANQTFLISDGEDVSTTTLLLKVAKAYGVSARLLPFPAGWIQCGANLMGKGPAAERLLGSLVVDSSKARELLDWSPVVTMDEQLQKMAKHDACL